MGIEISSIPFVVKAPSTSTDKRPCTELPLLKP
jgi:hypothetical protein